MENLLPPTLHLIPPSDLCLKGHISLPASKSLSNRAQIIKAVAEQQVTGQVQLDNLSEANDTVVLQSVLASDSEAVDIEDAGTAMRFSLGYFALSGQSKTISGTARMHERPVKALVDVLRKLGADIEYLEKEGYPPVRTKGFSFSGLKEVAIPANISSQFISSLLLCAPLLPQAVSLNLIGTVYSRPYIDMTLRLCQHFGAKTKWQDEQTLVLDPSHYQGGHYRVEPDWSSASYWFSLVALAKEAEIFIPELNRKSLQGDAEIVEAFAQVADFHYVQEEKGAWLKTGNSGQRSENPLIDFLKIPDMAQTLLPMAVALGKPMRCTGMESLKIKETDRVEALRNELAKFGGALKSVETDYYQLTIGEKLPLIPEIATYKDHRMALGLAPLSLVFGSLNIENPKVVAKSYPSYWQDLQQVGFTWQ